MSSQGRRERKREATRNQIIQAAQALFVAQNYETITIDEITQRADVAKGTFYLHFRAKEEVALEVYNGLIRPAAEQIDQALSSEHSAIGLLRTLFLAASAPAEADPHLARAVFSYGMKEAYGAPEDTDNQAGSLFASVLEKIVVMGQAKGELRADLQSGELALMLGVLFATIVWRWAAGGCAERLSECLLRCLTTCLEGMAA